MKRMMILLVAAAIGCAGRTNLPVPHRASGQAALSVPIPAVIESFPRPAASTPGRNVFAFRSVSASPPPVGQAGVPVLHGDEDKKAETIVVRPPDPPPPARYLGAFGPQTNPILVFKESDNVVNVPLRRP
jgi:hypothetical protein